MKYKVGDKVLVRGDLNDDDEYWMEDGSQCNHATSDMVKLKSKVCTIKSIRNGQYQLEDDPNYWNWTDGMFEPKITGFSYRLIEKDDPTPWDEWRKSRRSYIWTTRDGENMLLSGMKTGHIKNSLALLKKANTPREIKDGVFHSSWIEAFEKELQYREMLEQATDRVHKLEAYCKNDIKSILRYQKENKEDIEMSNTNLIENKLKKEMDALDKAERKEIKDKFYETSIGKAAKAFNEALERDGNENQKENCMIDEDDLMERSEEYYDDEIDSKYKAKRQEVKEYYAEAQSLFENADTYEQKHEILTSYGILKGPKAAKAKVEVK